MAGPTREIRAIHGIPGMFATRATAATLAINRETPEIRQPGLGLGMTSLLAPLLHLMNNRTLHARMSSLPQLLVHMEPTQLTPTTRLSGSPPEDRLPMRFLRANPGHPRSTRTIPPKDNVLGFRTRRNTRFRRAHIAPGPGKRALLLHQWLTATVLSLRIWTRDRVLPTKGHLHLVDNRGVC